MGGVYGIFCKVEYFNTWPMILKEELAGFATVEIVYPAHKKTIPESTNFIASPSGNYSTIIDLFDIDEEDDVCVYVVSDGGNLFVWGQFCENRTHLTILISEWQRANKQIFSEMYDRTTLILKKMHIDYKQPEEGED